MSNKNILKILLLCTVLSFSSIIATAEESPGNFPMGLYGDVTIGGSPAPAGTTIDAKVGTDVKASTKVINSGKYGDMSNYLGAYAATDGTNIDVYVNNVKVATIAYTAGKSTRLDLNAPGGTSSGGTGGSTGGTTGGTGGGGGVSGAGGVTPKATAIQQQAAAKETAPVMTKGTPVAEPTATPPVFGWGVVLGVFGLLAIGAIAIYALKKMGKI